MTSSVAIRMTDPSQVAAARRLTVELAKELAWGEEDRARAGILATEAATNLVRHARDGTLILEDGYSTAGSPGTGLGAIRRISSRFDLYSTPQKGTVLLAQRHARSFGRARA
jgi:anti-sigma regulatory factor (Ser/Thr protein kinase)